MYIITASVIHGHGRGVTLGFPTANLAVSEKMHVPMDGVFAAWAYLDHVWFRAAVSVGRNKTFHAAHATIEAYILNTRGNFYGKSLTLVFVRHLRPMRRFQSIALLKKAMAHDIVTVQQMLTSTVA